MTKTAKPRRDLHQDITDRFIRDIEAGTPAWRKPWETGSLGVMPLRHNGKRYQGMNVLLLWASGAAYASPYWMTYKQAQTEGANVRKGEKSSEVVFVGATVHRDDRDKACEDQRTVKFLKTYRVFNAEQIDGLADKYFANERKHHEWATVEALEAAAIATGADVRHGGNRAFYAHASDHVQMPERDAFMSAERYYSTLFHEIVHWTGAAHRLDRTKGRRFGDSAYAFEELVAEIGTAFVCSELGLEMTEFDQNAAYVASWLEGLRNDKTAIFKAASLASAAAEYVIERTAAPLDIAA